MVWIKYTVGQNTSKYFERLLAFKDCDQNHLTLSTSFFNFPFEEIFSYKKKRKKLLVLHSNIERQNAEETILFLDMFLSMWLFIFGLVYCQLLFKYITFVFNRFLYWPKILCKVILRKIKKSRKHSYLFVLILCVRVAILYSCRGSWTLTCLLMQFWGFSNVFLFDKMS